MTSNRNFSNDPTAVRAARQYALTQLAGYAPELLEVVELLVSELATNSVLHTESGFTLRVDGDPRRIRISVTDHGSGSPEVQGLDPERLSGRGLALVEMLSSSWGVRPSRSASGGKTVWLVLDVTEQQAQADASASAASHYSVGRPASAPRGPRRRGAEREPRGLFLRGSGRPLARRR